MNFIFNFEIFRVKDSFEFALRKQLLKNLKNDSKLELVLRFTRKCDNTLV